MLLLWIVSAGVQMSGRRSVLKLAAGLSATGAGMQTAAGAEGLQQVADVYQNFDRALVAKQREVAAPLVDAKQRGDAKMVEQGKKFDATMEKLNNCQVFRPVGDGGGCALTNGQKVFAFSDVLCHNCEGALGAGPKERRVSLADFTAGGKWVVLWFFPEGGLFGSGNEAEAVQFERMLREFAALDAVVVGCSTQSAAEQRRSLVAPRKLTFPFLSDAGRAARHVARAVLVRSLPWPRGGRPPQACGCATHMPTPPMEAAMRPRGPAEFADSTAFDPQVVAEAYGAADDFGTGTKRQTFIIDPTGRLRCQHARNALGPRQLTRPPTAPEAQRRPTHAAHPRSFRRDGEERPRRVDTEERARRRSGASQSRRLRRL